MGLDAFGRTHLIGVGGAGMSAIAVLLVARGLEVSGSDAREGVALAGLRRAGVTVWVGHDAAHVERVQTVVVSTAVRESNPELVRARELGLVVVHRSQALAALMAGRQSIAVAGAHGKTTTSAMVAVTLAAAGLDPSFAIGGTVLAELSGPAGAPLGVTVTLADHPAEHLEPAEEALRLRRLATDLEAEAARDAADPPPEEP